MSDAIRGQAPRLHARVRSLRLLLRPASGHGQGTTVGFTLAPPARA